MSVPNALEHFLKISIVDSKHFSEEDLFTELATGEGCVLFECPSLLKASGIDLMDCPLQIILKIFVRQRLKDEAPLLYHMILPLAVISKHFLQPPHEWDTWVGLLPSNNSLEAYPAGDIFTQAVILLLADKTSPKLRLKFRYHNPELHAHMALQKQSEEERRQQQNMVRASYGQQRFQDLHKITGLRREKTDRGDSLTQSSIESVPPVTLSEEAKVQVEGSPAKISADEAPEEALKSATEAAVPNEHSRLDEQNLAESLRFAMLGALGDGALSGAFAEPPALQAIRARYPQLWLICQDVSKMANDMAQLGEAAEASGTPGSLEEENARLRAELEQSQLQLTKAEEEIARLKVFHGQSPEIDLL